jgi:hypothetical protein
MCPFALIFNFRLINSKNEIIFFYKNKTIYVPAFNFKNLHNALLNYAKIHHADCVRIDFDYCTIFSPYIN